MPELKSNDRVVYCPIAFIGHYGGKVLSARADGTVDLELDKETTGPGETVVLRSIAVVANFKLLTPGTCARAP